MISAPHRKDCKSAAALTRYCHQRDVKPLPSHHRPYLDLTPVLQEQDRCTSLAEATELSGRSRFAVPCSTSFHHSGRWRRPTQSYYRWKWTSRNSTITGELYWFAASVLLCHVDSFNKAFALSGTGDNFTTSITKVTGGFTISRVLPTGGSLCYVFPFEGWLVTENKDIR